MSKTIVQYIDDPKQCLKRMRMDSELLESQGISVLVYRQYMRLETPTSSIYYIHRNSLDNIKGMQINLAIINDTWSDYPEWESSCLAPAIYGCNGKIIK